MKQRSWTTMLLRTAGMRAAVLPISGACALTSAGLTVQYAGVLAFGFIIMIAQLQIALPFADLGLGAAVARAVARAGKGRESVAEVRILVRRTALVLGAVGIGGSIAATLAGVNGLWSTFFRVPDGLGSQVDLVMSLVLCIFFMGLPMGLAARVLMGRDRTDLLVLLGLIPPIGNLLLVLLLVELEVSPIWLAVGLPLSTVTYVAICASLAFLHPRIGLKGLYAERADEQQKRSTGSEEKFFVAVRLILLGGLPVLLAMAGRALSEQHGRLVLARVATAADVSEYAMALQLYMPVYSVLFMSAMVLWPRFAVDPDIALWRRANAMFFGLGLAAAMGFALLTRPVSNLVTGGELVPSWGVVLGMAAALVAQSMYLTQANLLTDRRGFWRQAAMSLTLLALVVPGTILGVRLGLGAAAPGISMAIGVLVAEVVPGLIMAHRKVSRPPQDAVSPDVAASPQDAVSPDVVSPEVVPPAAEPAPTQFNPVPLKGSHRESSVLQQVRPRS